MQIIYLMKDLFEVSKLKLKKKSPIKKISKRFEQTCPSRYTDGKKHEKASTAFLSGETQVKTAGGGLGNWLTR